MGKAKKNLVFSFISEALIFAVGFIIPRLFVLTYGSETNGLFNSTNQLLQYLAIFEAGIGSVMLKELYKPIVEKDKDSIRKVYFTGRDYYQRVSWLYLAGLFIICVVYSLVIKSSIPSWKVFLVVLFSGLSNVLVFFFVSSKSYLINADGNYYFVAIMTLLVRLLNYGVQIVAVLLKADIVVIKGAGLLVTLFNIIGYNAYFNKHYKYINSGERVVERELFHDRKYYMQHQVANLAFSATDTVLLTFACGLNSVSIYSVYNMVVNGLMQILNVIVNSLTYILGQSYAKGKEYYCRVHDAFKMGYMILGFTFGTTAFLLYIPFIRMYIGNADINYEYKGLAFLFSLIFILNSTRRIDNQLASIAGYAKETLPQVYIELGTNVFVSVCLVFFIDIYGVLIGTAAAILYRYFSSCWFNEKNILNRKIINGFKYSIVNYVVFFCFVLLSQVFEPSFNSVLGFIWYGFIVILIVGGCYIGANAIIFKKDFISLIHFARGTIGGRRGRNNAV